eukprot:gene268-421_t
MVALAAIFETKAYMVALVDEKEYADGKWQQERRQGFVENLKSAVVEELKGEVASGAAAGVDAKRIEELEAQNEKQLQKFEDYKQEQQAEMKRLKKKQEDDIAAVKKEIVDVQNATREARIDAKAAKAQSGLNEKKIKDVEAAAMKDDQVFWEKMTKMFTQQLRLHNATGVQWPAVGAPAPAGAGKPNGKGAEGKSTSNANKKGAQAGFFNNNTGKKQQQDVTDEGGKFARLEDGTKGAANSNSKPVGSGPKIDHRGNAKA